MMMMMIFNQRKRNSNTRLNKHSEHWSRKNASVRQLRQARNIGAIKNETLNASGQKAHSQGDLHWTGQSN